MNSQRRFFAARIGAFMAAGLLAASAGAAEPEITLVIKGHRFEPAELQVPANKRLKLTVRNQDTTPEEFESHSLNREKLIPAGGTVAIYVGPLEPGRYEFFGEFNPSGARGALIAR